MTLRAASIHDVSAAPASVTNQGSVSTPLALCVTLYLAALAVRLIYLALSGAYVAPDTNDYLLIAQNLRTHHSFSLDLVAPFGPTVRRPPGYPFFLAALGNLANHRSAIAIVQSLLDSLIPLGILQLSRRIVPFGVAVAAAVLYALHPGAIFFATSILSESLFTFLLFSGVGLFVVGLEKDSWKWSVAGGLAFGLAVLTRPIVLPLVLGLPVVALIVRRPSRRAKLPAVFLAGVLLMVIPWTVRSSAVAGRFTPVAGSGGISFYLASLWYLDQRDQAVVVGYSPPVMSGSTGVQADPLRLAVANIAANPAQYLRSRLHAYPHLFLSSFDSFTGFQESFSDTIARHSWLRLAVKIILLLLFSLAPFVLALVGLRVVFRSAVGLLSAVVWMFTLLMHLPMFIEYRFWVPVVPFMLVSAASGYGIVRSRLASRLTPADAALEVRRNPLPQL